MFNFESSYICRFALTRNESDQNFYSDKEAGMPPLKTKPPFNSGVKQYVSFKITFMKQYEDVPTFEVQQVMGGGGNQYFIRGNPATLMKIVALYAN